MNTLDTNAPLRRRSTTGPGGAWLIGPFIDAWLKGRRTTAPARRFLQGFIAYLDDACVGSIQRDFDAEEPVVPRGCIPRARSVAEVLQCGSKTAYVTRWPDRYRIIGAREQEPLHPLILRLDGLAHRRKQQNVNRLE